MDRVDASVESMLKNLASLVRGSQFGGEADKPGAAPIRAGAPTDDHLLEVVASQLVGNCQDLFAVISSLRRAQESGNYARWLEDCRRRRREAAATASDADAALQGLRVELVGILAELEGAYKE